MVSNYGYPIEIHFITTRDGYILQHHRIPGARGEKISKNQISKPVVLMTHSLLGSSPDWVVLGPNRSLGIKK